MCEPKIYNVNAHLSFVDVIASKFLNEYQDKPDKLSELVFLLPNRRACQSLTSAFVRQKGKIPTILPRIVPIADVEEDEVFLSGSTEVLSSLSPVISKMERTLLLTCLIMQKPAEYGVKQISLAQSYSLAENLSELIDLAYNENLDFSQIKNIVPTEFAEHWQETLKLLDVIIQYWPQILQERGVVDSIDRRNKLLQAEINLWKKELKDQKIIIAGTTAAFPILKELVKTVINMPNGEVYLYGVDKYLEDSTWNKIDENHPQYEIKELLDYLQINRNLISDINNQKITPREQFVSEIMRPAETSSLWRQLLINPISDDALKNIHFVNCDDIRQEAQAIALIIRHNLEVPEKTTALVTSDRNLSRRVIAELKKWEIIADDSAGQPLSLTPIGIYLRLIINVLIENFSQKSILTLLKHPFTSCSMERSEYKKLIYNIEVLWRKEISLSEEQQKFLDSFYSTFKSLIDLYQTPKISLKSIFIEHIKVAETLANTPNKSGEKIIWRKEAGKIAGKFVSEFLANCEIMNNISPNDYLPFLEKMLIEQNVRTNYGMHPRVKILGPIEARLAHYDTIIIGEVNEGTWPKIPNADLWMSRPMKKQFGFPLPERSIGVMASDFAHLLHSPEVFLTRADRIDGTPTNKSRWWLRFETVLSANYNENKECYAHLYDTRYSFWAKNLERATQIKKITPPCPTPDVSMRPRKLSASNFEKLMRDPYTIFAKYILKLYPLEELDKNLESRDFGNLFHKIIEDFNNKHKEGYPENAKDEILKLGENLFFAKKISPEIRAFWWSKFVKMVDWIVKTETTYRQDIKIIHNEIEGNIKFIAPAGEFMITAKADRVDETIDGKVNIIDYKTGNTRSKSEIITGMAPQLSIEGLIAQNGGFSDVKGMPIKSLRNWKLGTKEVLLNEQESQKSMEVIKERIQSLISLFDFKSTAYLAKPNPSEAPEYSDYDHLSRYLEWSVKDEEND